jgi:hypothetical protein
VQLLERKCRSLYGKKQVFKKKRALPRAWCNFSDNLSAAGAILLIIFYFGYYLGAVLLVQFIKTLR